MKIFPIALSCIFIVVALAMAQEQFEPTPASRRNATASGRGQQYVAAMEALAPAAAAKGSWDTASLAYNQAAIAAIQLGQLQKSIALALQSAEMAEKGNYPYFQAISMLTLADTYGRLGQPQKEREWLDKTAAVTPLVTGANRDILEARLNQHLGENHLRENNAAGAVESLSSAVKQWETRLASLRSLPAVKSQNRRGAVQFAVEQLVVCLHRLGQAYLKTNSPPDAVRVLQRGIAILTKAEFQSSMETSL